MSSARRLCCVLISLSLVCVVAVTLLSEARAQESGEEASPPARQVRVYGIVTQPDGQPAAKVELDLDEPDTNASPVTTGADGSYSIVLEFRGPGWCQAWVDRVARTKTFVLDPAEDQRELRYDIRLLPMPMLTGTICLPDGGPASSCTFEMGGMVDCGTIHGGPRLLTATTDKNGRYRTVLPHGDGAKYHLFLSQPDKGCAEVQFALDMDHPEIVKDIALQQGGSVRGEVYGYPGRTPVEGAEVRISSGLFRHFGWSRMATSDAEGRFEISVLPPGEYGIYARKEGWGQMWVENPRLEVGEGWELKTEIALGRPFEITGRIFAPDGRALRDAQVDGLRVKTDGEGRYAYRNELQRLPYGTVQASRHVVLNARVEGVGVSAPVQLDMMQWSPQPADIHLLTPGTIRGEIRYQDDDQPAVGVGVRLIPVCVGDHWEKPTEARMYYDQRASDYGTVKAGNFTLEQVIPGDYVIEVWGCTIYQREQQYATAFPVTVPPDGKPVSVVIPVTQKPRFQGRLIALPSRAPGTDSPHALSCIVQIAGGRSRPRSVYVQRGGGDGYTAWTSAMGTGRFDIVMRATPEPPATGGEMVSNIPRDVEFVEGAALQGLDLHFTPGASVSGLVLMADGKTPVRETPVAVRPTAGDALMLASYDICGQQRAECLECRTDTAGHFELSGLLPGDYEVQPQWDAAWYGDPPTLRLRLAEGERKGDLVFQATKVSP